MNLKELHPGGKPVSTKVIFKAEEGKVISLQIDEGGLLKEHVTTVPALLICVEGEAVFENVEGLKVSMKGGDLVHIAPDVKHWIRAQKISHFILIK